jgi:membrane protein DedA with SNARE-associated domain
VEKFLEQYGYLAVLIGTFMEGETSILVASSLIHRGLFLFPYTIVAAFAGSFISDWLYYLTGRFNGKYFVSRRPRLQARIQPVMDFFLRHKLSILFSYRFLYGFRIIIPLAIGMSGLRPVTFLFYSFISGCIWATVVAATGYGIGLYLNLTVQSFEENVGYIILGFGSLGLLVGYTIHYIVKRQMHLS